MVIPLTPWPDVFWHQTLPSMLQMVAMAPHWYSRVRTDFRMLVLFSKQKQQIRISKGRCFFAWEHSFLRSRGFPPICQLRLVSSWAFSPRVIILEKVINRYRKRANIEKAYLADAWLMRYSNEIGKDGNSTISNWSLCSNWWNCQLKLCCISDMHADYRINKRLKWQTSCSVGQGVACMLQPLSILPRRVYVVRFRYIFSLSEQWFGNCERFLVETGKPFLILNFYAILM